MLAPPRELAPPPRGNPRSATANYDQIVSHTNARMDTFSISLPLIETKLNYLERN